MHASVPSCSCGVVSGIVYHFRGFLHAHVSYLSDNSPACLMLLSNDREKFFSLQESRQKIVTVSQYLTILSYVWTIEYYQNCLSAKVLP